MKRNKIILLFVFVLALAGCKTQDKASELNYMQNVEQVAIEASQKNNVPTIQEGDQLIIFVTAKDMNVVKPFNQNYSSGDIIQRATASSNSPSQGQETIQGPSYIVDSEGNIDFPVLGKLNTTNKMLVEFKDELRRKLSQYIISPTVNLRIANYKVTVLGEVNKPGQYIVPEGQTTILNALGFAGDATVYGNRKEILIVRNENGQLTKQHLNLLDANFMNSPFYFLKQNDVIYVPANQTQEKLSRLDPNMPIYISVAGILVTILALVFKK